MDNQPKTSSLQIAATWLVVAAPLIWGVSQTLLKALALFK